MLSKIFKSCFAALAKGQQAHVMVVCPSHVGLDAHSNFQHLLLINNLANFNQLHRNLPWVNLFQICSRHLDTYKIMAAAARQSFLNMAYFTNFKHVLVRNLNSDFIGI